MLRKNIKGGDWININMLKCVVGIMTVMLRNTCSTSLQTHLQPQLLDVPRSTYILFNHS